MLDSSCPVFSPCLKSDLKGDGVKVEKNAWCATIRNSNNLYLVSDSP